MTAIIPEVLGKEVYRPQEQQSLNVRLKKVENSQTYNYNNSTTTTNNTTINEKKGFFMFILEIIFFPVVIVYKGLKALVLKLDFNNKYKEYRAENIKFTKRKKMLKKLYKMQGLDDEIL